MLIRITNYNEIDQRKLMDIYSESNFENTDYFFPDETDKDKAVKQVEEGFLNFIKNEFLNKDEATYWVLEEDGMWISALRICKVEKELYYLEALETRPDQRKQGYGYKLLHETIEEYKKIGPFVLCDCVSKRNIPSLKTHEKCGFKIVSDNGYDYLEKESNEYCFGLEYRYLKN